MAFVVTSLATGGGNTTGFTTASVAVNTSDILIMITTADSPPSITGFSGLGVTWAAVYNQSPSAAAMICYVGTVPAGTSGTVAVSWSGSRSFLYELLSCASSPVPQVYARLASGSAIGGASSPTSLSVSGAGTPATGWVQIGGWGMKTNSSATINSFTPDAVGATWVAGALQQRTTGSSTQLGLNTQWALLGGDATPSGTFAWSTGTISGIGAVVVLIREKSWLLGAH